MPQPLSSKDQANFRQLVKFYEAKQYKKALKTADQLLKKNPNHGDTEAMKALVINSLGSSDEAFELGKLALRHDIKSYICWHVYGLLYRSVKNYEESIKAYKTALKLEPESVQILRDLAFLQAQMRDYHGYIQSRRLMLQAKPVLRQNWTALAVAQHLAGELVSAEQTLKTYEGTLKQPPPSADFEHSEAQLYRSMIIEESGDTDRALEHLESIAKANLDRVAVMEARARILLKLNRLDEAEQAYRALLERNNEYRLYYECLEKACGLERSRKEDVPKLVELYDSFIRGNDRVDAPRRIPLDFLEGTEFRTAADNYLKRMLKKGVPSTFTNIKGLYMDIKKRQIILELVEGYLSNPPKDTDEQANGDKTHRLRESCLYFLSQHYNYHITRDLSKAMTYINQSIELDPKSVVYIQTKARILKHLGNNKKAAKVMDEARQLDEKDRYINTKCAKYQLRNNQNELAIDTMGKFTRNEAVGGPFADLLDMQCMWFLTEDGDAYLRRGKLNLALKRFKQIFDIFETWEEDQFDFHQFSMRKGPIRAYIDMIRWEDRLREHPFFSRAAISAVKLYVMLHDNPNLSKGFDEKRIPGWDKMNDNDRKKSLKKMKKAQEDEQRKQAEKATPQKKNAGLEGKKEDADPNGIKLLETKSPLDDAMPFVNFLVEYSPKNIKAQLVSFDVYIRREKYLLALKCLKAAEGIDPRDPGLHERIIQFRKALDSADISDPKVNAVLQSCTDFIPTSASLKAYNKTFLEKHHSQPQHFLSALRAGQFVDSSSVSHSQKEVKKVLNLKETSLSDAYDAIELLRELKSEENTIESFKVAARKIWPEATAFEEGK